MAADAPKGRRYEIIGLLLLAVGLISIGGLLDWNVGFIGLYFAKFLRYLFGLGAWVASGVILLIGTQYVTRHRGIVYSTHFFGLVGLFISLLAILHHFLVPIGAEILPEYLPGAGGLLGGCSSSSANFSVRRDPSSFYVQVRSSPCCFLRHGPSL